LTVLPFNNQLPNYGWFETKFDTAGGGKLGYVDDTVANVPDGVRQGVYRPSGEHDAERSGKDMTPDIVRGDRP
jgi:hypothetical protein